VVVSDQPERRPDQTELNVFEGARSTTEPGSRLTSPVPSTVLECLGKRSPHEATCPRIASVFRQGRSMPAATRNFSDKLACVIDAFACPILLKAASFFTVRPPGRGCLRHLPMHARYRIA